MCDKITFIVYVNVEICNCMPVRKWPVIALICFHCSYILNSNVLHLDMATTISKMEPICV